MQTILGAGGAIGTELAKTLKEFTYKIRLANRNPEKVNMTDELMSADLLNMAEVRKAVQGSSIVYLTVGFPYGVNILKKNWPTLITNIISACKEYNAKLVFFDNIYMYGASYLNGMTEEIPVNPPVKRCNQTKIADMIMDEVREGKLTALIARSADFYGPASKTQAC